MGMDYMGAIIWQKVTTTNTTGGASIMGSFPYPRNGILKIDYEFILIFKKQGDPPKVSKEIKDLSKLNTNEWNNYFAGHWNFAGERQDKHLAMFPEELPHRLIRMFSFVGDTVLDPFLGSGTTSLAAKNLGRNSVGYEINPTFIPIIKDKLRLSDHDIFVDASYDFITRQESLDDIAKDIESLPYKFSDPHALNKKIDPRKLKFGSKIENSDDAERVELFSVKEVLSPELLMLSNGLTIRLIGVTEDPTRREEAIVFLSARLKGHRIYLKFDKEKHDHSGNLLSYVYLKNKTFINSHLIRSGLVEIDSSREYRLKHKFLSASYEAKK
jgi:site-specific DNA-methyltransferase (adenine-specific)